MIKIGSIHIARGVGLIFGSIFTAKLYAWGPPRLGIGSSLLGFATLLAWFPYVTSVLNLHLMVLCTGAFTSITNAGCQLETRMLHGDNAGPWLAANNVAFSVAAAAVPLLSHFSSDFAVEFLILSVVCLVIAILVFTAPSPPLEQPPRSPIKQTSSGTKVHSNKVGYALAMMVFFVIGTKVTTSSYLRQYVAETGVVDLDQSNTLIFAMWMASIAGAILSIHVCSSVTTPALYTHIWGTCMIGTASILVLHLFPLSHHALYAGVAVFGFCSSPILGYCLDLNNRITTPSAAGMAILMLGISAGDSTIPYITSKIWSVVGPQAWTSCLLFAHIMPIPLLFMVKSIQLSIESKKAA
eukprot:CAMPEP_0113941244 /NCGR_PEP_ID=MMETSP1339-20121228/7206_1 /TAXON_ID=94617 /ORGANISM="Fibrocapsa japonica" /LENGTH=353 /DNA_ID=CAMNT_0000945337 /DNA_START=10 /DNA_END=1071 /DNA_ORIENTATION=+ /assembly_acc=CAM_ASM_000762